jgi:chromosome segregation ATPase
MDQLIVTLIVGLLATPIATMVVYLTGRKKNHAESQAAIAMGANNAVEAITSVLESLKEELEETKNDLKIALREIENLRQLNEKLIKENKELHMAIASLTIKIEQMSKEK